MSMNRFCYQLTRLHSDAKDGPVRHLSRAIAVARLCPASRSRSHLAVMVLLTLSLTEIPAWAQPGNNKKATGSSGQKKAAPVDKPNELKIDSEWLPPSYQPPPEPLAIMELDQPIATKEELTKLNKEFVGGANKFAKALRNGDLSPPGKAAIEGGIRYKLATMTLKENRDKLPNLHKRFIDELGNIGTPNMKPNVIAATSDFVNHEVIKQIPDLFKNNFYVRLHAVLIVSELDYSPGHALLVQVIQAKSIKDEEITGQPLAVKIAATQGLIRILKFARPAPAFKDRTAIAHAVVDQLLTLDDTHWWYQHRLIEALRYMDVSVDAGNQNKPFVLDALLTVIKDPERSWIARTKACYAIGRVPLPPGTEHKDVVNAVAECALQLAQAAAAKPNSPMWKGCFWDVYLAFRPNDSPKDPKEKDEDAEKKLPGGLLARSKGVAQPAYELIVPIVRDVLGGKPPAAADILNLQRFVPQAPPGKAAAVAPVKPQAPAADAPPANATGKAKKAKSSISDPAENTSSPNSGSPIGTNSQSPPKSD
jgi:hypothetical protein